MLVYDRATGTLVDEKMPTYIRLGIRAIYRSKFGTVRKGAWRGGWMGERGRVPNGNPNPIDTPQAWTRRWSRRCCRT